MIQVLEKPGVLGAYLCGALIVAFFCTAIGGCGATTSGPATTPAIGTVTYQGKPAAGANVIFYPAGTDEALASQAVTDTEGHFELKTHVGGGKFKPGVVPGRYTVAITKLDTAGITSTLAPPKNLLPRKYATTKTSKLTADVSIERENYFEFPLTPD